jgi:hypothetical protein
MLKTVSGRPAEGCLHLTRAQTLGSHIFELACRQAHELHLGRIGT